MSSAAAAVAARCNQHLSCSVSVLEKICWFRCSERRKPRAVSTARSKSGPPPRRRRRGRSRRRGRRRPFPCARTESTASSGSTTARGIDEDRNRLGSEHAGAECVSEAERTVLESRKRVRRRFVSDSLRGHAERERFPAPRSRAQDRRLFAMWQARQPDASGLAAPAPQVGLAFCADCVRGWVLDRRRALCGLAGREALKMLSQPGSSLVQYTWMPPIPSAPSERLKLLQVFSLPNRQL